MNKAQSPVLGFAAKTYAAIKWTLSAVSATAASFFVLWLESQG